MIFFQRLIQKILEKIFQFCLNIVYKIKFKKIYFKKTKIDNQKIKFSIILPTYNSNPKYLIQCIDSVISQEYQNWELCISDDASNYQETINTLKKYTKNQG